jgi:hypothetical protein
MPLSFPVFGGNPQANASAVRPPVITSSMLTTPTYAIPPAAQGTTIDAGGSGNHLPPSYFSQGNSGNTLPTGGSGLGAPGNPTTTPPCNGCNWLADNWFWLLLGAVVLGVILLVAGVV